MYKIFSILIFFFFAINSVSASVIPDGKCAIITGASKSKKDVLKALKKYSDYVDPIAVESNNGYFAFSLGIYEKSESKSVLNEFKGKGLIPKDSYCGNVKRFIAILYPNKDYTALIDQPSNQNESTASVDNSSSTSLEVSNLRTENQNLKLRISSLLNEVNKLKNNTVDSDSTNLLKISNLSNEVKVLKYKIKSLENENNKMRESIVVLKKENTEIKEKYSKPTKNTDTNNNNITSDESVKTKSPPQKQSDFLNIVIEAQTSAKTADNNMQKGGILAIRNDKICELFGQQSSLKVRDWIGTVKKVTSNSEGKGVFSVILAKNIDVTTWNNAFSDTFDKTLIEPGTQLFNSAANLKKKQKIKFSGEFISSSQGCIGEQSLSLSSKLSKPDFVFRFSNVSLLK